jgi:hypothetical protein
MDAQAARGDLPEFVDLRTGQHEDVLVAGVRVERDPAAGTETQERGGGAGDSIAIEAVNLDTHLEGLPRDADLPFV